MNARVTLPIFKFFQLPRYTFLCRRHLTSDVHNNEKGIETCGKSKAAEEQAKKLRAKTPIGKLEEQVEGSHPYQEKEPLKPWPGGVNPNTGNHV